MKISAKHGRKAFCLDISKKGKARATLAKSGAVLEAICRLPQRRKIFLIFEGTGVRFQAISPSSGALTELWLDASDFTSFEFKLEEKEEKGSNNKRIALYLSIEELQNKALARGPKDSLEILAVVNETGSFLCLSSTLSNIQITNQLYWRLEQLPESDMQQMKKGNIAVTETSNPMATENETYSVRISDKYKRVRGMLRSVMKLNESVRARAFRAEQAGQSSIFSSLSKSFKGRGKFLAQLGVQCVDSMDTSSPNFFIRLKSNSTGDIERRKNAESHESDKLHQYDVSAMIQIKPDSLEGKTNATVNVCLSQLIRLFRKFEAYELYGDNDDYLENCDHDSDGIQGGDEKSEQKKKEYSFAKGDKVIIRFAEHSAKVVINLDGFSNKSAIVSYMASEESITRQGHRQQQQNVKNLVTIDNDEHRKNACIMS